MGERVTVAVMEKKNEYNPDYVSPPGETLLETIEAKGISRSKFARMIAEEIEVVDALIIGKAAITSELATKLEIALGVPACFWNNREAAYRNSCCNFLLGN